MVFQIILGLSLSALIGLVGYWRNSLSPSGVLGAVLTGTLIFGLGGIVPGTLLVAFFVSSSVLSHYRAQAKERLADKFQKGSRRDLGQALANGGWATVMVLILSLTLSPALFAALVGALAAVTADTWATEVGVLSSQPPRLVTTGRSVPIGTSGGITILGAMVSLFGGLFIGVIAVISIYAVSLFLPDWLGAAPPVLVRPASLFVLPVIGGVSGLLGSLFDSLLGATVQAIFYCDRCHKETERPRHSCGAQTRLLRGYGWLDNDVVNFLASVAGSAVAVLVFSLFVSAFAGSSGG
ncbi:MAG: DUF92 domain-containing protein [Anaerolineae bacterium]